MSARKGRKREEQDAAPSSEAPPAAPPADDEIEILEVTGVNETETPERDHAAPMASTAEPPSQVTPAELEEAIRERDRYHDLSQRQQADFDNFRKRAERERQETRRYALLEPLREFLPVADNLERALSAGGSAEDLKRGVEMILRQMQELLRRFGVHEVAADGEVFNPALHEAVARVESDRVAVPTVTETLVRGFMLHDRLLRPAMVKVAVPPERPGSHQNGQNDQGGQSDRTAPAPGDPGSRST
jgi:molecular chaperone GrpE